MVKLFIIFLDATEAPTEAPPAAETTPGGMRMSIIHIATSLNILGECKSLSYAKTIFIF